MQKINENELLIDKLNMLIITNLRTTKNPWKTCYMSVSYPEKDYLMTNYSIDTKFKQTYSIIEKLNLTTCRYFPNRTMCQIMKNQLFFKFTRKRKLKYYADEVLNIKNIEEKHNRLTVKFLVEREILTEQSSTEN